MKKTHKLNKQIRKINKKAPVNEVEKISTHLQQLKRIIQENAQSISHLNSK